MLGRKNFLLRTLLAASIAMPMNLWLNCSFSFAEDTAGSDAAAKAKEKDDAIGRALMGGQTKPDDASADDKESKEQELMDKKDREEEEDPEKKPVKEPPAPKPAVPAPKAEVIPPDQALQKAKIEIDRKRYSDAKLAIKQSLAGNPSNIALYMCLYDACCRSNDWSDAAYSLEKVMEIDPSKEKELYADYGQTLYKLRRYDKAKTAFAKAMTFGKDKEGIKKTLIQIALHQNDDPEAIKQYQDYLKLKPSDGDMHWEYANFLYRKKKIKESIPEYKLAADNKPDDAYAQERIAYLLMSSEQDYEGSIGYYKRAIAKNGDVRLKDALKYAMRLQKQAAGPTNTTAAQSTPKTKNAK